MGHPALTSDEALHLWVQLAVVFVAARTLGILARRVGQPEVVGSLVAGVLLGPSVLGAAWPASTRFLLPAGGGSQLLAAVTGFCLLMLLIALGAETNLPLIRQLGRAAATVSVGSIVVPLAVGFAATYALAGPLLPAHRLTAALLLAGALSVSSLPIIARLVAELGVTARNFGQLAFAVATVNDIYGFLLLVAVSVAATSSGAASVLRPVGGLLLMLAVFVLFGQRIVDGLLRAVRTRGPNPVGSLSVVIAVALAAGAAMQAFDVEAALGAFFAGVVVGRSRFAHTRAMEHLESFSDALFAPLYFATAGLQVDLRTLDTAPRIGALLALLVVAVLTKAAGIWFGARAARLAGRETVALTVLLNGRGAMQVILGTAGLRLGLLSAPAYTVLLTVSILTSALVAPALRRLVGDWPGSRSEQERLAHEERLRASVIVRGQRLLVPAGIGGDPAAATALLDRVWPDEAELTVLSTWSAGTPPEHLGVHRTIRERNVDDAGDDVAATLAEANLGYGVIGVGFRHLDEPLGGSGPLSGLLNRSPLPVVLVRSPGLRDATRPLRRVAVAVNGTTASRAAEEVAHRLCARESAQLHVVHVVPAGDGGSPRGGRPTAVRQRASSAKGLVAEAQARALEVGLWPQVRRVETEAPVGVALADYVAEHRIDLLVVGTRLRRVEDVPFLGRTVEDLLVDEHVPGLAVVALPDAPLADADEPYVERAHA
jgi:Kef-type K+ transport system membrane component KefB/nucleotide-binding universal stress UspA family protein